MKKISILILILAVCVLGVCSMVAGADVTLEIEDKLYIGEYDAGTHTGVANIVFGTVDESATVYGIIIEDKDGNRVAFAGRAKGVDGKFGVAVYNMVEGDYYTAQVYSGDYTNVTAKQGFYANQGNEVVVKLDWNGASGAQSTYKLKEGNIFSEPTVNEDVLYYPANGVFAGWELNGKEYDFSRPVTDHITLDAIWESNGKMENREYVYDNVDGQRYRTNIGATVPADLSDGSSVVMEMDVTSGLPDTNFQIEINALAWIPGRDSTGYNNNFTGTGHISFCGNSAYNEGDPNYKGYVYANGPSGYSSSGMTFGEVYDPSVVFASGNSVKVVYTAPTSTKTGSFVIYTKGIMEEDSSYIEVAYMKGIDLQDVYSTEEVYLWLSFTNTMTWATPTMTFRNFRIYKEDGKDIPTVLWNHADTEITYTDLFASDVNSIYEMTIPGTMDASKAGYLMTSKAVDLQDGGYIAMEMDVLMSEISKYNVNFGPAIWQYLGMSDAYGSSFHDSFWFGNPMYVNSEDGRSHWKTEDASNKSAPTLSALCVEDIWKEGNSVKMVYNVPTATKDGSIVIYTKKIEDSQSKWSEVASAKGIKVGMVMDTSKVIFGLGVLRSMTGIKPDLRLRVTNLKAYTGMENLDVCVQVHASMEKYDHVVNYDLTGGSGYVEPTLVNKNGTLPEPDCSRIVAPSGLMLQGWLDEDGNLFDFSTPITSDMTLKASWGTSWDYVYKVEGSRIVGLTSYGKTLTELQVPTHIAGTKITEIGYNAFKGESFESIVVANTVTTIYDEAFRDCLSLDTVTFSGTSRLTYIGDSAFRGCEALSNITLPPSITTVGELAFYGATQSGFGNLYNLNLQDKKYYSPKYTYEFMGEDVMPIGGYIEPSVGYFAEGITLEQVMKTWLESGTNIVLGIGQSRYGTSYQNYFDMLEYLEKYGGMMIKSGGSSSMTGYDGTYSSMSQTMRDIRTYYVNKYASYAGAHVVDEPGISSWDPEILEYSQHSSVTSALNYRMDIAHLAWTEQYNRKLYFVNLLPINSPTKAFIWGADNYNYAPNTDNLWADYEQYANYDYYYENYIKHKKPEVFCYDFYPLWANGNGNNSHLEYPNLNNRHFEQLYKAKYYTKDYSKQINGVEIPFWNFVQVTNWGNAYSGSRAATYNEVVWQINTALAFGSKGYIYFVFTDYGDISGEGKASGYGNCPMNIDGTIGEGYYDVQSANRQSQAMAKWTLNANVDHIAQYGTNPNGETINSAMFTAVDTSMNWSLSGTSGVNHLVSYMKYYSNNNQYDANVAGNVQELYFVCNNGIQSSNNGNVTLNFGKNVSGSYIYDGVEHAFSGTSLTVNTNAGEAFAVLLNK